MEHTQPSMIKSAFHFKNGKRIIVFTSDGTITTYECDENFNTNKKPFAICPLEWSKKTAIEYHHHLRNELHSPESFIKEQSTMLDDVQPQLTKEELHSLLRETAMRCNIAFPENEQDEKWFNETCDISTDTSGNFMERLFAALGLGNSNEIKSLLTKK